MWSEGLESWWMGVSWKVRPRGNLTMRSSRRAISIHVVVVGHSARLIAGVRRLLRNESMKLLSSIVILPLLLLAAYSQAQSSLEVFDPVPGSQRAHLAERLNLLVEYQRTKQYDNIFKMLPKVHTQHPELTREKFLADIRMQRKAHIVDFVPAYTKKNPTIDGEYAIYGCAKVREGWSKKKWQAATYASLENGEWYFSDLLFTFSSLHARNPAPCGPKKKR